MSHQTQKQIPFRLPEASNEMKLLTVIFYDPLKPSVCSVEHMYTTQLAIKWLCTLSHTNSVWHRHSNWSVTTTQSLS